MLKMTYIDNNKDILVTNRGRIKSIYGKTTIVPRLECDDTSS